MNSTVPPEASGNLSRGAVALIGLACAQAVAATFYAQPLLASMAAEFDVPYRSAGSLVAVTQVGYLLGLVLILPLGDLTQRRRLVLFELALMTAALAAAGTARSHAMLLVALTGVGVVAVVIQMLLVHAASLVAEGRRGRVVGAVTSGVVLGLLQARSLTGVLASIGSWRTVYLVAAGVNLLVTLLLLRYLPQDPGAERSHQVGRPGLAGFVESYLVAIRTLPALFVRERVLRLRGTLGALIFASLSIVWTSLPHELMDGSHSLSQAGAGWFGLTAIVGALVARYAGSLADRGAGERATGLGLVVLTLAWLLLGPGSWSLTLMLAGLVFLDGAVQAVHVTNQGLTYAARPDARSRLIGAYMVFYSIGTAGGSVLSTHAYARGGWSALSAVGATMSIIALGVWAVATVRGPRNSMSTDQAPTAAPDRPADPYRHPRATDLPPASSRSAHDTGSCGDHLRADAHCIEWPGAVSRRAATQQRRHRGVTPDQARNCATPD